MNPLSPFTYYLRHKKSALLQITLISLTAVGLFVLVAVLDTLPGRGAVSHLTKMSRVIPTGGPLDAGVVSQIQTHPDVAQVIFDNGLWLLPPTLIGQDTIRLMGVVPEDAQAIMQNCNLQIKQGRMFGPRSNEIVLSEEVARALNLQLGDSIERSKHKDYYEAIAAPLVLVGILEGVPQTKSDPTVRLGFVSSQYLHDHEAFSPRGTSLLVLAKPGRKDAVDTFLETGIASPAITVETFAEIAKLVKMARTSLYAIFGVVNSVVAAVVAFVVGVINQIALTKRLSELGLLHALGHRKSRLIRRMTQETAFVAGLGSLCGLGLALLVMWGLKRTLFYNLGMDLNLFNPAPFLFVLPIPVIVIALALRSVKRTFTKLDAVAIVERGQLTLEPAKNRQSAKRSPTRPDLKPLAALTFYRRHRRRGLLIMLSTALMILATAFPVFLLSSAASAMRPEITYLKHISKVIPAGGSKLDPGIVAQIRNHPTVQHVIPSIQMSIRMIVPPGGETGVGIYGVSEADMALLMDTFDMQVQAGRLPRPRSNEIALSATIATNRGLHIGDIIGGRKQSEDTYAIDDIPVEMVIVGLFSPEYPWLGLASLEFLQNHETAAVRSQRLLLIPHKDRKSELDTWLETTIDSAQTDIVTYATEDREYDEMTTSITFTFALLECMIALIAAIAMATLNTIFFAQRQEEFGVLNAIGRSRRWLIGRTMKETGSIATIAWIIGAVLCGFGLMGMQAILYTPRGLRLNFFSPGPWLFTTPLPISVILASAATIAWMLRKLDPVAVIERM